VAYSLDQFDAVLKAANDGGQPYLLIGGQAVYFWASLYIGEEQALEQWRPFTSKDIDFQGGRFDLIRFAKQLGLSRVSHTKRK